MRVVPTLALAGLAFTLVMVSRAKPFPLGVVNELTSPADVYRFGRVDQLDRGVGWGTPHLPAVVLAYAGDSGRALRQALDAVAPQIPDGLFVALELEGLLAHVPPSAFRDSPLPEIADGGMETVALAFSRSGARRRWTTVAGPEADLLLDNPGDQAQALVAFMQT
jgi:hypothetical protein